MKYLSLIRFLSSGHDNLDSRVPGLVLVVWLAVAVAVIGASKGGLDAVDKHNRPMDIPTCRGH